jgi:type I restriction enzyme S subunit
MNNWKKIKIEDIISFGNGKVKPKERGNIPIFGGNGILGYGNEHNYKGETIIIGRVGAYCGSVFYEKKPIWVSDNALAAKPKGENNAKFLYYFLKLHNLNQWARGSSHPLVTQSLLNSLEFNICVNPIIQTRIAQILTSFDDKIELLQQMNQTLETMAQAIFKEWFPSTSSGSVTNSATETPVAEPVEANAPPPMSEPIPVAEPVEATKGWRKGKLGEILQPKKGKNITKSQVAEGKIPVVAGGLEPSCYHNESNTESPVVTISSSGANAGFVRLYHTPVWSSDSCYIDNSVYPYVYFSYLVLKSNQEKIYNSQEGCAQPHIYARHIMDLDINISDEKIVAEFENIVSPLFEKILENQSQIRTLTTLRDTLLPKLMSGTIRVET